MSESTQTLSTLRRLAKGQQNRLAKGQQNRLAKGQQNRLAKRPTHRDSEEGFTLLELVVVLFCLSVLLAILARTWPGLMHWSRVLNAEAQVAQAGQAWCASFGGTYGPMEPGNPRPAAIDMSQFSNPVHASPSELLELEKHLGIVLPKTDIWGTDIEYWTNVPVPSYPGGSPMPQRLLVRSLNANADEDEPYAATTTFKISETEPDIVWVNCEYVQYAVR